MSEDNRVRATSFRAQLKGTISDFLRKERMQCIETEEAFLEIVVALSHYTEEGSVLFPQVIICDDLDITLNVMQGTEPIQIGNGPKSPETVKQALKRCAPLTQKDWVIYIKRTKNQFIYGVFRGPFSPTALDIRETILSLSQESQDMKIILASQLSEKAVELIGSCSGCLNLHLSALPEDTPSPKTNLELFIDIICSNLDRTSIEPVSSFLRKTLTYAMRYCHGTLMAVNSHSSKNLANLTDDGVILPQAINLATLVNEYQKKRNDSSLGSLNSYSTLLTGMLSSDGIVLFDDKAKILGYNFFIKQSSSKEHKPRELLGGARRRAYQTLCEMVDNNKILGCFMQSSDSTSSFYKGR